VVWVEREDGKKLPIDPERVPAIDGEFERINADPAKGPINQVRAIPEEKRWQYGGVRGGMLYRGHFRVCAAMERCRTVGIRDFNGCRKYLESTVPMTQSGRESRNPQDYKVDRSQ
jgi:hypothetical protein